MADPTPTPTPTPDTTPTPTPPTDPISLDGVDDTPPVIAAGDEGELVGAPEGEYEAFAVADGREIDADLVAQFIPLAKAANLSQAGAQRLVDLFAGHMASAEEANERAWSEQQKAWKAEWARDPVIGGTRAQMAEKLAVANQAIRQASPQTIELLQSMGITSHPGFVALMYQLGKAQAEPPFLPGNGVAGGSGRPTDPIELGKILYPNAH